MGCLYHICVECKGACGARQLLKDFWHDPKSTQLHRICYAIHSWPLADAVRAHTHTHPSIIINNIKWSWMCMAQYAQLQCPHAVAIFISQIDRSLSRRERYVFSRQHSRFRNQCKCGFWRANTKLLISLLYSGRQESLLFVRAHFLFS